MNIIFMGTPEFAVPALKGLITSKDHNVVAIFSQKPKAKGRGLNISKSAIHTIANEYNIPVYTESLKKAESQKLINTIVADIIVVCAYGFIVPTEVLNAKKYGCINIHPSKLPRHRGAAPLQRTIIEGDTTTAVCIMQMDAGLDTGDIIIEETFNLPPRITLQELHDNCAKIGSRLLLQTLDNINSLPRIKQSGNDITYAHKLTKQEGTINWHDSAFKIDCMIRGMNPWPGVYFMFENKIIKVITAEYSDVIHNYNVGQIINKYFDVACSTGILHIKSVKPEGKLTMSSNDYFNGNRHIKINTILK